MGLEIGTCATVESIEMALNRAELVEEIILFCKDSKHSSSEEEQLTESFRDVEEKINNLKNFLKDMTRLRNDSAQPNPLEVLVIPDDLTSDSPSTDEEMELEIDDPSDIPNLLQERQLKKYKGQEDSGFLNFLDASAKNFISNFNGKIRMAQQADINDIRIAIRICLTLLNTKFAELDETQELLMKRINRAEEVLAGPAGNDEGLLLVEVANEVDVTMD